MPSPHAVLFLVPALPVGGAERQIAALVRALDRSRFRPIVACQHALGPVADEIVDAPVHLLSHSARWDPRFLLRTAALMRREQVRVVLTHGFSTGVAARIAGVLAGVPVRILAEHSTGGERDMTPARHRVNRALCPWTSAWVALAEGQLPYLRDTKGIPAARIRLIPNGIDPAIFEAGDGRRVRAECGIPEGAPVAGILAVLRPEKDHRTFLLAARFVADELAGAHFLVVGDGPCRADLEREAGVLDLASRVHFLGGRDDVPDVLAAFDVAVLCSDVETLPLAFLEAMASRLPLVGTRVGGLPELIEPERNGLLVEPKDPRGLADAMLRVLRDPETARAWGRASRAALDARFTEQRMVRGYETLFTELLAARGVT